MSEDESPDSIAAKKLLLLKSPLLSDDENSNQSVDSTPDLRLFGDRFEANSTCPQFQKHEDASLLELFFDLFFAANYTVFSQNQGVSSHARFNAYVGYFCLLWVTWLLTGLYDVRFLTDSIFERAARGVHLGVMVGFAVVAPNFKPDDQNVQTMRTMSLILAVSRFCLAVEYGSILWHIRKYREQRLPMGIQVGLNFIASMIYLGITFRFRAHQGNSRVFVTWYVMAGMEVVLAFLVANIWAVLSFKGTHLMKRLGLLTVVILGDAIIVMAQNVVTIVKNPDAWTSQTIGILTAATTTIYFIFLVYFDWMKHPKLPALRQQFWTCMHFPFHLALVLFMQGFTQFILWSKIVDVMDHLSFNSVLNTENQISKATSEEVFNNMTSITTDFFKEYPPKYYSSWQVVHEGLANISTIPDEFWPQLGKYVASLDNNDVPPENETRTFRNAFFAISASMENALFERLGVDLVQEVTEQDNTTLSLGLESQVNLQTWQRFDLVFSYAYIAAGLTLVLMTVLSVISRRAPWRPWSIIRTILFLLLGIGMSLVSLLHYAPLESARFRVSPWLLPTICLVWTLVLFLTHVHHPPPLFFKNLKRYGPVKRPRNNDSTEYKERGNSLSEARQQPASRYDHNEYNRQNGHNAA